MYPEEKIVRFNKEFSQVVSSNLANICIWLEHDIELSEKDILIIMKRVEAFMYHKILGFLSNDL